MYVMHVSEDHKRKRLLREASKRKIQTFNWFISFIAQTYGLLKISHAKKKTTNCDDKYCETAFFFYQTSCSVR